MRHVLLGTLFQFGVLAWEQSSLRDVWQLTSFRWRFNPTDKGNPQGIFQLRQSVRRVRHAHALESFESLHRPRRIT